MISRKFQKKIEDFLCGQCGAEVKGNGFTNHCPRCLWSKHVDINPGDRKEECQGLMEPRELLLTREGFDILHRCVRCGKERKNKSSPEDAVSVLMRT